MGVNRRDLLRILGFGGGAGLLGGGLGFFGKPARAGQGPDPDPLTDPADALDPQDARRVFGPGGTSGRYGRMSDPPPHLGPRALDQHVIPPPYAPPKPGVVRELDMTVIETRLQVGLEAAVDVWAYNGTVPGPVVRATEGEEIAVTLHNPTPQPHTIHFHGAYDVTQDGWSPVPPRERRTYHIAAACQGLHPYHCHTPPYARHFSRGMYGVMIVDPPGGRRRAHEFVLALCGWDLDGDGQNELYAWNGIAGFFGRHPIKVPVGELVRLYVVNLVEYDPVASFHLHAHTFDVYRSGTSSSPQEHTDVVTLGQTERAILEFRLPRRGRYMFHPHQIHMAERGAMGWIVAV